MMKKMIAAALLITAALVLTSGCGNDSSREAQINAYLAHGQALCMTIAQNSLEAPTALDAAKKYLSTEKINLTALRSDAAASMKESFKLKSKYAGRMQQLKDTHDMVVEKYPHLLENAELKKILDLLVPVQ